MIIDMPCKDCILIPACRGRLDDLFRVIISCKYCSLLNDYIYQSGGVYEVFFAHDVVEHIKSLNGEQND